MNKLSRKQAKWAFGGLCVSLMAGLDLISPSLAIFSVLVIAFIVIIIVLCVLFDRAFGP